MLYDDEEFINLVRDFATSMPMEVDAVKQATAKLLAFSTRFVEDFEKWENFAFDKLLDYIVSRNCKDITLIHMVLRSCYSRN